MNTKDYTLAQEQKLAEIKQGKNQKSQIEKLAEKWGKPYPSLYAKWNSVLKQRGLWNTANGNQKPPKVSAVTAVPAAQGKNIIPFVLEVGAPLPSRGDHASTVALKDSLRPLLEQMEPNNHSIPVWSSQRTSIRKFLTTEYPNMVFTISPIKDNKKMVRIFRRK